LKEYVFKQ